jgi:hypothetical protein
MQGDTVRRTVGLAMKGDFRVDDFIEELILG